MKRVVKKALSFSIAANLVALLVAVLPAQQNGSSSLGQAKDAPPKAIAKFEKQIQSAVKTGKIVGCSAMLIKDGKLVYTENWGLQNRKKETPVTTDTIWRIYSMSKPVTSVAVMQLVESGKIGLDEPVSTYLPSFKNLKVLKGGKEVDCKREMTVRDLLRHTSGLTYGFFGNTEVDKTYRKKSVMIMDKNLAETVEKLSAIPLLYQPGSRWHYSLSTDVLGRIVEVVSKQSFDEYLKENLFVPLKMNDTFFTVPKEKRDRFAEMYAPDGNGGLKAASRMASFRFLNESQLYSGGGGLCSTMQDYLRFCQMILDGGKFEGKQILKAETIGEMFTNQLPKGAAGRGFQFGLGFAISPERHMAWGGAAGTRFWIDPKNDVAGVFMIQINPYQAKPYGDNFKKAVYDSMN